MRRGYIRKQVNDPIDERIRHSIVGPPGEVNAKAEAVRQVRRDLRLGVLTQTAARAKVAAYVHGMLRLKETWDHYVLTRVDDTWKAKARAYWVHHFGPFFGDVAVVDLTEDKMVAFEARCRTLLRKRRKGEPLNIPQRRGLSPRTIRSLVETLKSAINRQIEIGRIDRLPWGSYKPPSKLEEEGNRREAARSVEDLVVLARAAEEHDRQATQGAPRVRDLARRCLIKALTGLRQAEGAALSWADFFDFGEEQEARLMIRHQVPVKVSGVPWEKERNVKATKTKKAAQHTLNRDAAQLFRAQRAALIEAGIYRADGPVFPGRDGRFRLSPEFIRPDLFKRLVYAAGLRNPEHWVPHSMRHSMVTLEYKASGGDIKGTMERARHTTYSSMMGYVHRFVRDEPPSAIPSFAAAISATLLRSPALEVPMVRQPLGALVPGGGWAPALAGLAAPPSAPGEPAGAPHVEGVTAERQAVALAATKKARAKASADRYHGRERPDFEAIAAAWKERGGAEVEAMPREVAGAAQANYHRADMAAARAKVAPAVRKARREAARNGTFGAWRAFLERSGLAPPRTAAPAARPERAGPRPPKRDEPAIFRAVLERMQASGRLTGQPADIAAEANKAYAAAYADAGRRGLEGEPRREAGRAARAGFVERWAAWLASGRSGA
jgi:integrase